MSLARSEWQKYPTATGPEVPCILGIDYLRKGYLKDPKGYWWAFSIAALEMEDVKLLSTLPDLSETTFCSGVAKSKRRAGAYHYYKSAPATISHRPGIRNPHSSTDLPTGETKSDQQNLLAL